MAGHRARPHRGSRLGVAVGSLIVIAAVGVTLAVTSGQAPRELGTSVPSPATTPTPSSSEPEPSPDAAAATGEQPPAETPAEEQPESTSGDLVEGESAPEPEGCIPPSDSTVESLTGGVNNGYSLSNVTAHIAGDRTDRWFIAGTLGGNDLPGSDTAVWALTADPTQAVYSGDIVALDAFAILYSAWPAGSASSIDASATETGVAETLTCVPGK